MKLLLAQLTPAERAACPPDETGWLCVLVLRRTGSTLAARVAETLVATPLRVALIVALAALLHVGLRRGLQRFVARMEEQIHQRLEAARERTAGRLPPFTETRRLQRLHAVGGLLNSALAFIVWVTASILALVELGIELGPVLAGAGLLGLALGFGAQNLVRDFLAGLSMLVEDQFGVGDWIDADGPVGMVERVGLRTTRVRDLDGVVWHIPNGALTRVGNLSQEWSRATLDVPISLDTDVAQASDLVKRVADELWYEPAWGWRITAEPEVWGLQKLATDGMAIRLVMETRPMENWPLLRELNRRLKDAMDEAGIWLPQPRRLVWVYPGEPSPSGERLPGLGGERTEPGGWSGEETGPVRRRGDPLPGEEHGPG